MTTLPEDCLSGVEARDPTLGRNYPVDFAVSNDTASLIFLANWWETENMTMDGAVLTYGRPIVAGPDDDARWVVQDMDVTLGPTDTYQQQLADNRDNADFNRPSYLSALLTLRDQLPEFNLDDWIAAFQKRPILDSMTEIGRRMASPRQMAHLYMLDPSGQTIDVLVLDERGDAVTAADDRWLSRAADDFTSQKASLPLLADYVNWLAGQQPYGGNALVGPRVFTGSGFLTDVATDLLSNRRVGI